MGGGGWGQRRDTPRPSRIQEARENVQRWIQEELPEGMRVRMNFDNVFRKIQEECREFTDDPDLPELADVVITILALPEDAFQRVLGAVEAKMETNRQREWVWHEHLGVYRHA